MARRDFESLSPQYARRIERTIGREAYDRGDPLYRARGQSIEHARSVERRAANQGVPRSSYDWRPAASTERDWRRVAYRNGVTAEEFDYELAARGGKWVGKRVAAIKRFQMMAVEDGPNAAEFMVDEYVHFREIDVDKAWFFYGTG